MVSAVVRNESGTSGQGSEQQSPSAEDQNKPSPFDMSAFDRFTFEKLSPVTSPRTQQGDRSMNVYSRFHPGRSSLPDNIPSPVQAKNASSESEKEGSSRTGDSAGGGSGSNVGSNVGSTDPVNLSSTPKSSKEDSRYAQEGHRSEDSTAGETSDTVTPSKADAIEKPAHVESSNTPSTSQEQSNISTANGHLRHPWQVPDDTSMPSSEGDRTLELENLCDSDSTSEPATGSSCSLDIRASGSEVSLTEGSRESQGGRGAQEGEEQRKRSPQRPGGENVGSPERVLPEHAEVNDTPVTHYHVLCVSLICRLYLLLTFTFALNTPPCHSHVNTHTHTHAHAHTCTHREALNPTVSSQPCQVTRDYPKKLWIRYPTAFIAQ